MLAADPSAGSCDYVLRFSFLKVDTHGPFCAWCYPCELSNAVGHVPQALRSLAFLQVTFIGVSVPGHWGGPVPKSSFRSPLPRWPREEPRPGQWHVHLGAPGATATALTAAAWCKQTGSTSRDSCLSACSSRKGDTRVCEVVWRQPR